MPHNIYIGDLALKIKNLQRSIDFYTQFLGFSVLSQDEKSARLSTSKNSRPMLTLKEVAHAIHKPEKTTGLYHFAIKLPTDRALADLLYNILDKGWHIQGSADHIVSKAIYFSDPDGFGIEIYTDRPKEVWEWKDGEVSMSTDRLDIDSLMVKASKNVEERNILHPDSLIGHIHLSVSSLSDAEWFYHELIGMDVTQRSYPGALFFSFSGYHHHIGVNTWAGKGIPPPPSNAVSMQSFSLIIPEFSRWQNIFDRFKEANIYMFEQIIDDQWTNISVYDPSGNGIQLRTPKINILD